MKKIVFISVILIFVNFVLGATIFDSNESVFFIGASGTKAGNALAGGCTRAWWDAEVASEGAAGAMTNLIGTNGAPINAKTAVTYTHATKNLSKTGIGTGVEVGMVAYISGTNITTGRYLVTTVTDANNIICSGIISTDNSVDAVVNVGGALDALQTAVDDVNCLNYTTTIYTNKAETLTAAVDFDTTGGSTANNSEMIIEGFHTIPGDMDYGQTYYQSPTDALINGIDANCCVSYDADGGAYDVFTIDNFDGLTLKNLYPHNTDRANGDNCIEMVNTPTGINLINCKFDDAYNAIYNKSTLTCVDGCYISNDFADTYGINGTYTAGFFYNCVFAKSLSTSYNVFIKCLFYGDSYGVSTSGGVGLINCIFYNQTDYCFLFSSAYVMLMGCNNIFMPAAADDYAIYGSGANGLVAKDSLRNSLVWSVAGTALTHHIYHNGNTSDLDDVIEADPLFMNATNGDFRLNFNSPFINEGTRTINGGKSTGGAWGPKVITDVSRRNRNVDDIYSD